MSYFMSCQKCGKETIGRYAAENSLCDECISDINKLSVEKLQEENNKLHNEIARLSNQTQVDYKLAYEESEKRLNTAKKYIEHVIGTIKHDGHSGTIQTDWILPDLEKAMTEIEEN